MLDSVIRVNKKYYLQTFLEECKYEIKKLNKWRILLMMILTEVHLLNLTMNLIVSLIMINLLMNLRIKTFLITIKA